MHAHVRTISCTAIAVFVGLFAASRSADAGLHQSFPVSIDPVNRVASGSLGSARNSGDTTQYIGCYNLISGYFDPNPSDPAGLAVTQGGGCYAVNSTGQSASCSLAPGGIVPMAPDSLIAFSWDTNGNCTGVQVWTFANLSPKQP